MFACLYFHKIWSLPKNSGPNPHTFQFLVEGTLDPNSQETSGNYVSGFPSSPEAADTPLVTARWEAVLDIPYTAADRRTGAALSRPPPRYTGSVTATPPPPPTTGTASGLKTETVSGVAGRFSGFGGPDDVAGRRSHPEKAAVRAEPDQTTNSGTLTWV